ncbi:hypothetical protein BC936DRAFT_149107, partial [Jimgerdemannia flammicorona]
MGWGEVDQVVPVAGKAGEDEMSGERKEMEDLVDELEGEGVHCSEGERRIVGKVTLFGLVIAAFLIWATALPLAFLTRQTVVLPSPLENIPVEISPSCLRAALSWSSRSKDEGPLLALQPHSRRIRPGRRDCDSPRVCHQTMVPLANGK